MILSNSEIRAAIQQGLIQIEPAPDFDQQLDATSLNLRLGNLISVPRSNLSVSFDLRKPLIATTLATIYERREIQPEGYTLDPGKFVLASTHERIALRIVPGKRCYAARVEGRSSFARCGLIVHFTAPTIHAGFEGPITLELINLGQYPIVLYPGVPICQLIFELVEGEVEFRASQFQHQITPNGVQRV